MMMMMIVNIILLRYYINIEDNIVIHCQLILPMARSFNACRSMISTYLEHPGLPGRSASHGMPSTLHEPGADAKLVETC